MSVHSEENPQSVRALPGRPYGILHFATAAEAQAAVAELGKGKVRIEFNTIHGKLCKQSEVDTLRSRHNKDRKLLGGIAWRVAEQLQELSGMAPVSKERLSAAVDASLGALLGTLAHEFFLPAPTYAGRFADFGVLPWAMKEVEADERARLKQTSRGFTQSASERRQPPPFIGAGYDPADLPLFSGRFAWSTPNPSPDQQLADLRDFFGRNWTSFPYNSLQTLARLVWARCEQGVCINACSPFHARPSSWSHDQKQQRLEWAAGLVNYAVEHREDGEKAEEAAERVQVVWDKLSKTLQQPYIDAGCGRPEA
jgi:hypothetical protein